MSMKRKEYLIDGVYYLKGLSSLVISVF